MYSFQRNKLRENPRCVPSMPHRGSALLTCGGLCSPLLALPPQEPPSQVGSGHPVPGPSSRCPGSDAHPGPQGRSSDLPLARLALPTQDPGTALVREPGRVRKGEGRAPHLTLCRPGDATCGSAALASLRAREGDAENETLHSPTF